ncbi:MAG TPA: DNA-processing protein DprA [Elusimicrobiota bacterium]|nr:DNA-processing protein DprA [Elusimicrobiota bacterium]
MTDRLDERSARILLNMCPEVGPARFRTILERFGTIADALDRPAKEWEALEEWGPSLGRRLHQSCEKTRALLDQELDEIERTDTRILLMTDPDYPSMLKSLTDAPPVLYVRGQFKTRDAWAVAVVGTRNPSPYGTAVAERLAREMAEAGVTSVSGLARGIDTVAHSIALKCGGRTFGVLGSGLSKVYPPENRILSEKIAEQGAVFSEFSMKTPPDKGHFPRRNRIISGLSLAVIVVEADETSGALITARLAGEQGRDVFAVPGSVFSKKSLGPHRLIKQGGRLLENFSDVLDEITAFKQLLSQTSRAKPAGRSAPVELSADASGLLPHLSIDPVSADHLTVKSGLKPARLSAVLLELEMSGMIRNLPGGLYMRTERSMAEGVLPI